MKIAVAYDNGNVFQHFGKSEMFKIYDVEGGQVVSGEVMDSNGVGHEALAGLLAEQGVRVVICGGMGAGAQAALEEAGIEAVSGAEGKIQLLRDGAGTACGWNRSDLHGKNRTVAV